MPEEARITLADVARKAGVSIMTVSLSLKGGGRISNETRNRVRQIAADLNYRPDPLLSSLATYRRLSKQPVFKATLGYLNTWPRKQDWKRFNTFVEIYKGAIAAAEKQGYKIEEIWTREPGMNAKRLSDILFSRGITGLLIGPMSTARGHLRLDWSRFSAVALGHSLVRPKHHFAANYHYDSVYTAVRQLRKIGYKRLALVLSDYTDVRVNRCWSVGFDAAQKLLKATDRIPWLNSNTLTKRDLLRWINEHHPDAIITLGIEMLEWVRELGFKVPEDLGYVNLSCDLSGKVAGIYQNPLSIGESAIEFLIGMIQRNEVGIPRVPRAIFTHGNWVSGKTVRQIKS